MRYEVRADTRFVSTGTVIGVFDDRDVISSRERIEVNGPETLTLTVPSTLDSSLAGDRVINVVEGNGDATEWRVGKLTRGRNRNGATTTVDCQGIRADLMRFSPIVTQQQANGDRFTHIEWVGLSSTELWEAVWNAFDDDADSVSYFTKGTCPSSTVLHDFVLDWETQGSALIELATVLGYELDVQAGSTSYVVNLSTGINSTLPAPLIAFRKNQKAAKYVEDHDRTATRIYPRALGDNAFRPTIGDLKVGVTGFSTSSPSNSTSAVVDIGTMETDQLKGTHLEFVNRFISSTGRTEITGSSTLTADTTTINFSTGGAFNFIAPVSTIGLSWDAGYFVRDSSTGQRLIYIPRSTASGRLRSAVLDRQDIPAISNVYRNGVNPSSTEGVVIDVTGGASSTSVIGPSPYVHHGTVSRHVSLPSSGDSISFVSQLVGGVNQERPHLSMQTHFYLSTGRVGVQFAVQNFLGSTGAVIFPASSDGASTQARATAVRTWHDLAIAPGSFNYFDQFDENSLRGTVTFTNISTAQTTMYLDSIQVVNEPVPAEQIVDGSAPRKLWNAGIELLRSGADQPAKLYDIDVVDLGRISTADYPGDAFQYGQSVTLFDPGIGITDTRRIKARVRDMKVEGNTMLELFDES